MFLDAFESPHERAMSDRCFPAKAVMGASSVRGGQRLPRVYDMESSGMGFQHSIGGVSAHHCLGQNSGMCGSGVSGVGVMELCQNLVHGCGRFWADELSATIEGPMLDAGGTIGHQGWWWLWLLVR